MVSIKRSGKKVFDQTKWFENRNDLISSLKKSNLVIGLRKKEVVALLGDEMNYVHSSLWTYYIGKKHFFFKRYLLLYFDKEDLVYKIGKN